MKLKNKKIILISISIIFTLIISAFLIFMFIKFDVFNIMFYRFKNYFGKKPLCNMREDRTFSIGNFVFPLCARCTGIVIGATINSIVTIYFNKKYRYMLLVSILLLLPLIIDGCLQYMAGIESTNLRRLLTGIIFSIGLTNIIIYIVFKITKPKNNTY